MKIIVSPLFLFFLLSLILSRDRALVLSSLIAVFIHESGHIILAKYTKTKINSITLNIYGANIDVDLLGCSYKNEIMLSLGGPIANVIFAIIAILISKHYNTDIFDFFIISSFFLASLNLIPAKGFDGGRILSGILCEKLNPKVHYWVMNIISFICFFILWTTSIYIIIKTGSYLSLFIFSLSLFIKLFLVETHN